MVALCAVRASDVSFGIAIASIWLLSDPSLVCCTTVTLVIFVPATVMATCIGPYWVLATAPVTVRAPLAAAAPPPAVALLPGLAPLPGFAVPLPALPPPALPLPALP